MSQPKKGDINRGYVAGSARGRLERHGGNARCSDKCDTRQRAVVCAKHGLPKTREMFLQAQKRIEAIMKELGLMSLERELGHRVMPDGRGPWK